MSANRQFYVVERAAPRSNSLDDDSGSSSGTTDGQELHIKLVPLRLSNHQKLQKNIALNGCNMNGGGTIPSRYYAKSVDIPIDDRLTREFNDTDVPLPEKKSSKSKASRKQTWSVSRSMSDTPCYAHTRVTTRVEPMSRSSEDFTTTPPVLEERMPPPLPPKDYPNSVGPPPRIPPRLHRKHEIHPIVRGGQKMSDTHYFLLEPKRDFRGLPSCSVDEEYKNINRISEQDESSDHLLSNGEPGKFKKMANNLSCCVLPQSRQLKRSRSDSERHLLSSSDIGLDLGDQSSVDSAPCCVETNHERDNSMNRVLESDTRWVSFDRDTLESFSLEEELSERTNCDRITEPLVYRKSLIDKLVELEIAPRNECESVLISCKWDIETAASRLSDMNANTV